MANYNAEQKQRYNERMIRKYKRLSEGSLDEKNVEMYYGRQKAWEKIQRDHIDANPELRRNPWRERLAAAKVKEPVEIHTDSTGNNFKTTRLQDIPKQRDAAFKVGKIDGRHLEGIDHVTDEVVITSERVHRHVLKKHSDMSDKTFDTIMKTIENPDFVFKGKLSNHELQFLRAEGKYVFIAPVRLITAEEYAVNPTHRNTILSFYKMKKIRASKQYGVDF